MAWQQDQNADDIVRSVVAGQQRRAINRARGTDKHRGNNGKKHQRDHGGDQFEQHIRDGQPLGGGQSRSRFRCTARRFGSKADICGAAIDSHIQRRTLAT